MKVLVLNNFAIGDTHLGKAVFAVRPFKKGDVLTQFTGEILHRSKIPKRYLGEHDRYVQIGKDEFMGPSETIDDYINHSCEPNSGLKFTKAGILLVALRDITEGEEITWDYSTTIYENSWKMRCECRTESCRKIIGEFALLDPKLQRRYQRLNVIPPYIKAYLLSTEYALYNKGLERLRKYAEKR